MTLNILPEILSVWKGYKLAIHGTRWKYAVLALLVAVFFILVKLLLVSAALDPVIPVLIIIAIFLLLPVAIFIIDLYFCETP